MSDKFLPTPAYQYRVREQGRAITSHAYFTRGQLNACETGRFIGFVHLLNWKDIDIKVICPQCHEAWWDCMKELDEDGPAECENCGTICQPEEFHNPPIYSTFIDPDCEISDADPGL